jgi:uncharacterized protein (DUF608 family)
MNPQFVLLVCRDYLWTADRRYLEQLYPNIVRAMDNSQLLDTDGDGLPDHDTRRNTYDGWNFFGTPSYIASLWLAALKAAIRMAQDMQDTEHTQKWQDLLERGKVNFEKKLWNGEYFNLWVDGPRRDECCMTDQLSGEWFAHLIGIGNIISLEKIIVALNSVFKYNFTDESGLINASYPPGKPPVFPTHHNIQAMAPWTGVEYAIGSMMLDLGMTKEGIAVVSAINDRYLRAGRFWNHVECGDHYYRAMCSWAVLLAATGFKLDTIKEHLTIQPKIPQGKAPWFASTAWGSIIWGSGQIQLKCESGSLIIKELHITGTPKNQVVTQDGSKIEVEFEPMKENVTIRFKIPLTIKAGNLLSVD